LINGFRTAGERLLSGAVHALEHHPRKATAAIAALLLSAAGGAFAVASSADALIDPATLPVREVVEAVEPLPVEAQAEALDAFRFNLYRTEATRSSDTAESLLSRLGINDPGAAAFLRSDPMFRRQVLGRAGRNVTVEAADNQSLRKLTVRWLFDRSANFQRYVVQRDANGRFTARLEVAPLTTSLRLASGVVRSSYFEATDRAGISDSVAMQVISIFEGDIDFNRGLKVGDRFSMVYETLEADGEPLRTGRVISAQFVNSGRMHRAMWFEAPGQPGGYFDLAGRSLERTFLASPMAATRVTSGYKMRFHPILHEWIRHEGVDYGGPVGTPVRTIGDGVVTMAGRMGSYGNIVIVNHGQGDETRYAHLSRISVRKGEKVQRGETVGLLGGTGRVTGPHLHFEFRENGRATDPVMALARSQPAVLSPQAKAAFDRASREIRLEFDAIDAAGPMVAARD
jgi:murein DD-endopeptidase MepM/ murein hydrolase activator NlpD